MEGALKSRGHPWDKRSEICKVQFSDAQPHSKGCLVLYEMGREERSRDLGHRGREERPIVVRAGLESLNDAFGSLARDAMMCANQGDCPTALIAQIATLCESLDAALCREVNHQPNTIAGHIAVLEVEALGREVEWLKCHQHSIHRREALRRLTIASQRGWSVVELVARSRT